MELNSREIATLIWLGFVVAVVLVMPSWRKSLGGLWEAFTQKKLLQVLAVFSLYVGLMIWFLHAICWWDWDQLKNTIIWTFSVALVAVFHSNKIADEPGYFWKWITENFQILAFVQFLVTLYTYPLPVELVVIPFVTLLTAIIAVGQNDPKTKPTAAILTNVFGVLALVFFGDALVMTVMDFWNYATVQTWRDLYIPIVLSILFLPFIFALYVLMSYETTFSALPFSLKDDRLRRGAKWRSILAFGPNVDLLRRWQRHVALHQPTDKAALKAGIQEVKKARMRERNMSPVDATLGWAPGVAKNFLSDFGLPTRDYHRSYDEEWFASSSMIDLGEGLMPNNIAYYVEGDELVAKRLKLKLNVNDVATSAAAEDRFVEIGNALLEKAVGGAQLLDAAPMEKSLSTHRIVISKDKWTGGIKGGFDLILTVETIDKVA